MRILLTGAAGLVGRAAAPVLRAAGHGWGTDSTGG